MLNDTVMFFVIVFGAVGIVSETAQWAVGATRKQELEAVEQSGRMYWTIIRIAEIGAQVSTWRFPGGYNGLSPMLSVCYLAGVDAYKLDSGKIVRKWVVNAAFNGGNSGGPLIHIETGAVFGVVSSKLAPITNETSQILKALENNSGTGIMYNAKTADGKDISFTEGQLVGRVLNELRRQVQLVIGQAVLREDLVAFLRANKIEP